MSNMLVTDAAASSLAERERKKSVSVGSIFGIIAVVAVAVCVALAFHLIHDLSWRHGGALVFGIAVLAGGLAYTVQGFWSGPVKCETHGDDEEI